MRICLICGEIFAWGKYGGFGRATRTIGRELVKRGIEVTAIVPRRGAQRPREVLDGMTVCSFPRHDFREAFRLYRDCDADIYHSQEPSLGTWLAQCARPHRKHVVTFRDTRDADDWAIELRLPSRSRMATWLTKTYEHNALVRRAVRRADARFCAAPCVGRKARAVYGLAHDPAHLPTPVSIPADVRKAETPVVCYVGRMDRRKRPEHFLELCRHFPQVRFVAFGDAQDKAWAARLREVYSALPNLAWHGFVDQFDSNTLQATLAESWILVNTAAREGLPNAFLEAAANQCAILSAVDPDGFASRFGCRVDGDDFGSGLHALLEGNRWRERGLAGARFVREHYAMPVAIERHCRAYAEVLDQRLPAAT